MTEIIYDAISLQENKARINDVKQKAVSEYDKIVNILCIFEA